jgi:hypothetical protein
MQQDVDAYALIVDLKEGGPNEERYPANNVHYWHYQFIFEVALKVIDVHL